MRIQEEEKLTEEDRIRSAVPSRADMVRLAAGAARVLSSDRFSADAFEVERRRSCPP